MTKLSTKTIREIAVEMPVTTRIFEELKIDYCCGGNKNFEDACRNADISPNIVEMKISKALEQQDAPYTIPSGNSPSKLIGHIVEKHHTFTRDEISRLTPLIQKVASKHGERHPELFELQGLFVSLCGDLIPHLKKEEVVLFPFITELEKSTADDLPAPMAPFGTVKNPIRMMGMEHDTAGDLLKEMRKLTGDYTPPEDACPSYQALYFGLEALEKDLHQHIHLENNILFPLAEELEN